MTQQLKLDAHTVVSPTKFAHVVLQTGRFDELKAWYETVLGSHLVFGDDNVAFVTYDDEHHRVAFVNMPGLPDRPESPQAGVNHFAYTFAEMSNLLGTYKRLKRQGIDPFWCINHGPTTSMYYRDPDGNQIELQVDNFATAEEANAWLEGDAFAANPIGVDYDPDALCEAYESGMPMEELIKQGSVPDRDPVEA